ncbi:RHS repeat-associated core domain-containing protein [Massilia sp. W12]|uniref:RHS repeat-associated core domain-containing protein n=1 Tax=Massilia sp. W12 TaxID=3126507 RepID=UPI0030CD1E8A
MYYNRYRYYDPEVGRFFSQDSIGLLGGENLYQYGPNAEGWVDPLGVARKSANYFHGKKQKYENPGHHDPSSGKFRGGGIGKTALLPCHHKKLAKHAIPDSNGVDWYSIDNKGVIHRFGNSNDGKMHWNGDSVQGRGIVVPPEVKKRL